VRGLNKRDAYMCAWFKQETVMFVLNKCRVLVVL